MRDPFSTLHPIINFIYFLATILFSMLFLHPVFLGISLICSIAYSIFLNGKRAVWFNFVFLLPMLIIVAGINPLFNHEGATILMYFLDNPITMEAVLYGAASATMFVSVIIWFSCYNAVITADKFIYLFGRLIPSLSLVLSMVLRFVPKYKAQVQVISNAQKCIGRDVSQGNVIKRAGHGLKIVSILTTWALENAIDTADSMRARGYGLKGRTSFSLYRFDSRDRIFFAVMCSLLLIILSGAVLGYNTITYFPVILIRQPSLFGIVVNISYAMFCLLPLTLKALEEIKWRHLK